MCPAESSLVSYSFTSPQQTCFKKIFPLAILLIHKLLQVYFFTGILVFQPFYIALQRFIIMPYLSVAAFYMPSYVHLMADLVMFLRHYSLNSQKSISIAVVTPQAMLDWLAASEVNK